MSRLQSQLIANQLVARAGEGPALALLRRRLKIHPVSSALSRNYIFTIHKVTQDEWRAAVLGVAQKPFPPREASVTLLTQPRAPELNLETLDALYAIKTTPYASSFLARVRGLQPPPKPPVLAVDWETRAPWIELMRDIREHYSLMQWVFDLRATSWRTY